MINMRRAWKTAAGTDASEPCKTIQAVGKSCNRMWQSSHWLRFLGGPESKGCSLWLRIQSNSKAAAIFSNLPKRLWRHRPQALHRDLSLTAKRMTFMSWGRSTRMACRRVVTDDVTQISNIAKITLNNFLLPRYKHFYSNII